MSSGWVERLGQDRGHLPSSKTIDCTRVQCVSLLLSASRYFRLMALRNRGRNRYTDPTPSNCRPRHPELPVLSRSLRLSFPHPPSREDLIQRSAQLPQRHTMALYPAPHIPPHHPVAPGKPCWVLVPKMASWMRLCTAAGARKIPQLWTVTHCLAPMRWSYSSVS